MHFRTSSLITAPLLASAVVATTCSGESNQIKNFIYVVPDGFGHASQTMARDYYSLMQNGKNISQPMSHQLPHDKLVLGSVRTQATDDLVTDSAAAATAFSSGFKSYNGAIGVLPDESPVASILEAAKLAGFKTGLVVTSRITHATPGAYAAHVTDRDFEDKIAEHQIGYNHPFGSVVDVLMGGGRCWYSPNTTESSCRDDSIDLLSWAGDHKFNVFTERAGFDALKNGTEAKLPYLGLFAEEHMDYEIDRDAAEQPSLLEMAQTAITSLHTATKDRRKGFFIMIEASKIDHAGHANDPIGHLHDTLMYNEVIDYIKNWIDENGETELLSAADHETGGLTLMADEYNPLVLAAGNSSAEVLGEAFEKNTGNDTEYLVNEVFPQYGVLPEYNVTSKEMADLVDAKGAENFANLLGAVLSKRAGVNWSTAHHSASDVALIGYAKGDGYRTMKGELAGNHDNTDLPKYIEQRLGLDLEDATERLKQDGVKFVTKRDVHGNIKKRSIYGPGCSGKAHKAHN